MNLIHYPHVNKLNESFQANDMRFAFCNEKDGNFECVMPWVKCREYFNELLMKNHHPNEFEFVQTYGFNYQHDQYPLDLSATRLAIKFKEPAQLCTFENNMDFLNTIEKVNGFEKTVFYKMDAEHGVLVGDKRWVGTCLLTNIFTLLVKLMTLDIGTQGFKKTINNNASTTEAQIASMVGHDKLAVILENLDNIYNIKTKFVDGTETLRTPRMIHTYSGIYAVLQYQANDILGDMKKRFLKTFNALLKAKPEHNLLGSV